MNFSNFSTNYVNINKPLTIEEFNKLMCDSIQNMYRDFVYYVFYVSIFFLLLDYIELFLIKKNIKYIIKINEYNILKKNSNNFLYKLFFIISESYINIFDLLKNIFMLILLGKAFILIQVLN